MTPDRPDAAGPETDPRFPSGPWVGFYLKDPLHPGRQSMELLLSFRNGQLTGEGRDRVGPFIISGRYDLATGRCQWTKQYVGRHAVAYHGYNEGKGIWGVWEITDSGYRLSGGFHIWPEGMPDPTDSTLHEEAELPAPVEMVVTTEEPVLAPAGQ